MPVVGGPTWRTWVGVFVLHRALLRGEAHRVRAGLSPLRRDDDDAVRGGVPYSVAADGPFTISMFSISSGFRLLRKLGRAAHARCRCC